MIKHRDITGRKQAEAEAQELRQELAHANRVTMLGQLRSLKILRSLVGVIALAALMYLAAAESDQDLANRIPWRL